MRLRGYYRQFEGLSDEEVSAQLRERAAERRRRALARIDPLDLSATTWHEFPHPDVVAAVTYAARRGINQPADPRARELRRELGRRHGLEADRVAVGNGAAEQLAAAARTLIEPGDELVTPWPSYPLYPVMARGAGGRAVPVARGHDPEAILAAVNSCTRVVALCNPNDPTGAYLEAPALRDLLERLPERVTLLLDQALVDYMDVEPVGAALELLDDFPRLLVFRTFSKVHGLAALRCGYVLGGPGSEKLLEGLAPPLGVSGLTQAGALEALLKQGPLVAGRRAAVIAERRRVADALPALGVDAAESQANFLWLSARGLGGADLSARLARSRVQVALGAPWGDENHVRATIQSPGASERLLRALEGAAGPGGH